MANQALSAPPITLDSFGPAKVAERVEAAGVKKANLKVLPMFALAILAGSFIGFGAEFCTLTITGIDIGYGLTKLIAGLVFSLGLILVVVAGAELFTGNNLLTIAWVTGAAPFSRVMRNWVVVFIGNLVGSVALAALMFYTRQYAAADYGVGVTAIKIAAGKTMLPFMTALVRGILCNILVCLAVWLCFAARTVSDKILAIVFPITAFVASGFEHSIANMYFIPFGLMLKSQPQVVEAAGLSAAQLNSLTISGFIGNLIPVTIGNLIGGGIMVGVMYWFIYLKGRQKPEPITAIQPMPIARPLALLIEGEIMKTNEQSAVPAIRLTSYNVASKDMFYSEVARRELFIRDDPETGFHIWGQIAGTDDVTATGLGEVLLEYAMTCAAQGSLPEAYREMDVFGKRLGQKLALEIIKSTPAEATISRAACALECVLESLDVNFTVDQTDNTLSYALDLCPLCEVGRSTGHHNVELAHHGLSALCHSLLHTFDPELVVKVPQAPDISQIFSIATLGSHIATD